MQDLRLALRALRATPVVSAVAALSLAFGIGANTAIFSLVNSLLLRALPVEAPQQLAMLSGPASPNGRWNYGTWQALRDRASIVGGVAAWGEPGLREFRFNLSQGGEMRPVDGTFVSGDFFATLGVPALIGRTFTAADDRRGGGADGAVAVISYPFWQRHFGGAASAIGATLIVNQVPYTVIGVTPPEFFGAEIGRAVDLMVPIGMEPLMRGRGSYVDEPRAMWLNVMVRVPPGQSMDAATAALRALQPQIREAAMPPDATGSLRRDWMAKPFELAPAAAGASALRTQYQRPLMALLVVVAFVLLIACANIANLLLARASARRHEFSVRLALGASRWRLARQLLVESLLLSAVGAGGGFALATWGSRALAAQLSTDIRPIALDLSIDWRVLAFTTIVTLSTTLLFGMAPALRASRAAPIDAMKAQGRGPSADARSSLSGTLVVLQVACSLVLIVAAGLFVRTFERLARVPLGFQADRVLVIQTDVSRSRVPAEDRMNLFLHLVDAVKIVPGVAHAVASTTTPLSGGTWGGNPIDIVGEPDGGTLPVAERRAFVNFVTPGWFATYGTPVRAGRDIDAGDTKTAPHVVVVNDAFARRFFPGRSALGARITQRPGRTPMTIVGVVGDAVYPSVREAVRPMIYRPYPQFDYLPVPFAGFSISVRAAAGPPSALAPSVGAALRQADENVAFAFRPLTDQVDAALIQERLIATMAGFFGGLALLLAGLGLYGVTAYAVSRRRAEIGIRLALGAAPTGVVRMVLGRVFVLMASGVLVGTVVSLWASRFVATLLYGLEPQDPATLIGAAAMLAMVATLAGGLPARKASRIDPAKVLRDS